MYRVGFGDCFLLSIPDGRSHDHVLVDCGVHSGGSIGTMDQVVADIRKETGDKLAVVVASHEHSDHISGFGSKSAEFSKIQVREVWMPWAMDPGHPEAAAMRRRRVAMVGELMAHFSAVGATAEVRAVMANLVGNEKAVDTLISGLGGTPEVRFLGAAQRDTGSTKEVTRLKDPAGLRGVTVRVLGPPSDPKLLRKMEPPASERYLRAGRGGARVPVNGLDPFARKWQAGAAATRKRLGFTAAEERGARQLLNRSLEDVAFALDSFVNNTSLVLLFSVRGQHLLFPGDAQYGNWKSWLDGTDASALLDQVSFLKVAHHGSHNATPKRALEGMRTGAFAAMVSTQSRPWKSIPQRTLMKRLGEKTATRVFRSDSIKVVGAQSAPDAVAARRFTRGPFWADYIVKL
jgi:beta-lactamase superfamily II metal-dependent hydrolase